MSALAALYPSATASAAAPVAPPAPDLVAAIAPTPAASPAADATESAAAQPDDDAAAADDLLDDQVAAEDGADDPDAAPAELEQTVETPPEDLRVDERKDFFADVRPTEPGAASPTDFASFVRSPSDKAMDMSVVGDGLRAAVKMGLGHTAMQAIWSAAVDASRTPITTSPAAAHAALTTELGDKAETTIAAARAWFDQAEKSWPGARIWLQTSRLGNDPRFIKQIAAFAQRSGIKGE